MRTKTKNLMGLLRDLSKVYRKYDKGTMPEAEARQKAQRTLSEIQRILDDNDVRDALLRLSSSIDLYAPSMPSDDRELQDFVSIEISVTDGFGFTRKDVRDLLTVAKARAAKGAHTKSSEGADTKSIESSHPADMLNNVLLDLHQKQLTMLAVAKTLGKTLKAERKRWIRKGLGKITGGAAVLVADATLLPTAAPTSFVAGVLAIGAGIDDLA